MELNIYLCYTTLCLLSTFSIHIQSQYQITSSDIFPSQLASQPDDRLSSTPSTISNVRRVRDRPRRRGQAERRRRPPQAQIRQGCFSADRRQRVAALPIQWSRNSKYTYTLTRANMYA